MKRSTAALVVSCAFAIASVDPASAESRIDLDEYAARLGAALEVARTPSTDPTTAIGAIERILDLPVVVITPDGDQVRLDEPAVLGPDRTASDADRLADVAARLEALRTAAGVASNAHGASDAEIQAALAAAYEGLEPEPRSWLSRTLDLIADAVDWLLYRLAHALTSSGIGSLFAWLAVLALGGAALVFIARVRRRTVAEARRPIDPEDLAIVDWRSAAEGALAAGDLDRAVPALYHVLVGSLATRGVVHDAPSLTAGECRDAVRSVRPSLTPAVDPATRAFERVVFGRRSADREDVDALRAAEREVRRS